MLGCAHALSYLLHVWSHKYKQRVRSALLAQWVMCHWCDISHKQHGLFRCAHALSYLLHVESQLQAASVLSSACAVRDVPLV